MSAVHLHLLICHVPIIGTFFALLILISGLLKKNTSLINLANIGFVIMAGFSIAAIITGELAESFFEANNLVEESVLEAHEFAAAMAQWASYITGFFALLTFFKKKFFEYKYIILIFAFITMGLMAYTGSTGGAIKHTELSINS